MPSSVFAFSRRSQEPPWNSWLFEAACEPEEGMAQRMRARLARAVEKEWQKSPERFELLREALASETPGAVDWIEGLLAAGASPNATFEPLHTALAAAAHQGFVDRVLILAPKSDANLVSQEGWTALSRAAAAGNAACVKILLPATADTALDATVNNRDALAMAVENNHPECVKLLLDRCDANRVIDKHGATLLMRAASKGFEQCVEALLAQCDTKKKDKQGRDALMHAVMHGRVRLVEILLSRCDPLEVDKAGHSALMLATSSKEGGASAKALLPHSDVSARSKDKRTTALTLATRNELAEIVALLLNHEKPPISLNDREEALNHALENGKWVAADWFAGHVSEDAMKKALDRAPPGALPAMQAIREREELAREIANATPTRASCAVSATAAVKEAPSAKAPAAERESSAATIVVGAENKKSDRLAKRPARRV